ncbi:hypothetical protein KKE26_02780 [bacterium]|nr:hypothetical protein [bacterium]MBU1753578.1 hypothetical protein [bacterium]
MAQEKENFSEGLLKILALIGGGWIAVELIKAFSREVYRCPHCRGEIKERIDECPNCKVGLIWKV